MRGRRLLLRLGMRAVALGAPQRHLGLFHYPIDLEPRPASDAIGRAFAARAAEFRSLLAELHEAGGTGGLPAPDDEWLSPLDAFVLRGFVALRRPRCYLEIGSGVSTTVVAGAIREHGLPTRVVSVDPSPRREVAALCDTAIRTPLEQVDVEELAGGLAAGDVVFFDGSHQIFQGGDVVVFMLELLPALAPGVLVGVHDIHLPEDYPPGKAAMHFGEQYLLAAWLLGGSLDRTALPVWWASQSLAPLPVPGRGSGFWLETA